MKTYLVSLLFAIAAHGALIFVSGDTIFRASIPVQTGSEAISIVLVNSSSQVPKSESPSESDTLEPVVTRVETLLPVVNHVSAVAFQEIKQTKTLAIQKPKAIYQKVTVQKTVTQKTAQIKKTNSKRSLAVHVKESQGVISHAVPTSSNQPTYPRRAIIRNQQGRVEVSMLIDKEGLAKNSALLKSSGYALLDSSVLNFIEDEKFIPAKQNGIAVASSQVFSFRFELN